MLYNGILWYCLQLKITSTHVVYQVLEYYFIMQISRHSDIGLRTVLYLFSKSSDGSSLVSTHELAKNFNTPFNHLNKVIAELVNHGIIESYRGRQGGIRLKANPDQISVGKILRILDSPRNIIECRGKEPCPLAGKCTLYKELSLAEEKFYEYLDAIFIKDLIREPTSSILLKIIK